MNIGVLHSEIILCFDTMKFFCILKSNDLPWEEQQAFFTL